AQAREPAPLIARLLLAARQTDFADCKLGPPGGFMLKPNRRIKPLLPLVVLSATAVLCPAGDTPNQAAANFASTLPPPSALREHVVNGKLRLTLEDAIRLTLLNNPDVRLARTPVDQAQYRIMAAYAPFDPVLTGNVLNQRSLSQTTN